MFLLDAHLPPNTTITTWAEPTDFGLLYEAVVNGCVVRADSEDALLEAVYGENVVVLRRAA